MNKTRRTEIAKISDRLLALQQEADDLMAAVEALRDEEQEYLDNMPEGLANSERGEQAQTAIDALDSARDETEAVSAAAEMAMSALDDAVSA